MARNVLTRTAYYKVVEQLRKLGQKTIRENKWSQDDVAKKFTTDLGFVVSRNHVKSAADALQWTCWPSAVAEAMVKVHQAKQMGTSFSDVIREQASHREALESAIREQMSAVNQLLQEIRGALKRRENNGV